MCDYCSFEKLLNKELIRSDGSDSLLVVSTVTDGRFVIEYMDVEGENGIINYCPICGRKLSEG